MSKQKKKYDDCEKHFNIEDYVEKDRKYVNLRKLKNTPWSGQPFMPTKLNGY